MQSIGIRQLEVFMAVARCGNLTKAADELFIAQPAISVQIKRLERDLGATLFERLPRGVRLTAAGEQLLPRAEAVLEAHASLLHQARSLRPRDRRTLRVSFDRHGAGNIMACVIRAFTEARGDVDVAMRQIGFTHPMLGLDDDHADVAVVIGPTELGERYVTQRLFDDPPRAAMSAAHPLADWPAILIDQLVREPFHQFPPYPDDGSSRVLRDFWLAAGHRDGEKPRVASSCATTEDWLQELRLGDGVSLATRSIEGYYSQPGLAFVPVIGMAPAACSLVWRRDRASELIDELAKLAVQIARRIHTEGTDRPLSLRIADASRAAIGV